MMNSMEDLNKQKISISSNYNQNNSGTDRFDDRNKKAKIINQKRTYTYTPKMNKTGERESNKK